MNFTEEQLSHDRPESLERLNLPDDVDIHGPLEGALKKIGDYTPSPVDWRDEVLYFLLPDRFSDEKNRDLLDRDHLEKARPATGNRPTWWWDDWAVSGNEHFQGGNLRGIIKRLDYLKNLGITAVWIGPVFKQRGHLNTYHGYGVQDFLEVEPRFGTRKDLVDLVEAAHKKGMRIILDIIFNHSGHNWNYSRADVDNTIEPHFKKWEEGSYNFGNWLDEEGRIISSNQESFEKDEALWPEELRQPDLYTKHGSGDLGKGDIHDPHSEHKISDFGSFRDFFLDNRDALNFLAQCYKYWIALTDVDGFRIDTLKHVSKEHGRNFCGAIKEYAAMLGKTDFLLIAEAAGGEGVQDAYLDAVPRNLDAVLDIGEMRLALRRLAKGLDADAPREFFSKFEIDERNREFMPSHRQLGSKHVLILDDHDHVFGDKERFSFKAGQNQVIAGVALQLFCLGIPCIYYGAEQELRGPEPEVVEQFLIGKNGWNDGGKGGDRYLREAMFGPRNPIKKGLAGRTLPEERTAAVFDDSLPGFGPFGTTGFHCFDENYFVYQKIAQMIELRKQYSALGYGRQYHRPISYLSFPFSTSTEAGQIVAFSRILDTQELVCIVNTNGGAKRGARILVDKELNGEGRQMSLILNTTKTSYPSEVEVKRFLDVHFIEVVNLEPSGVLIYTNSKTPLN